MIVISGSTLGRPVTSASASGGVGGHDGELSEKELVIGRGKMSLRFS